LFAQSVDGISGFSSVVSATPVGSFLTLYKDNPTATNNGGTASPISFTGLGTQASPYVRNTNLRLFDRPFRYTTNNSFDSLNHYAFVCNKTGTVYVQFSYDDAGYSSDFLVVITRGYSLPLFQPTGLVGGSGSSWGPPNTPLYDFVGTPPIGSGLTKLTPINVGGGQGNTGLRAISVQNGDVIQILSDRESYVSNFSIYIV
jgi:hypothetical protein